MMREAYWSCKGKVTNLVPIADELLRNLEELLNFLGHYGSMKWGKNKKRRSE